MKKTVTVFSIGAALFAVGGCCYSNVRSTHKGVEYRVTPCELIRASQTAAFALNESNKVEATAKVNIVLPVDHRLRAFVEANIAPIGNMRQAPMQRQLLDTRIWFLTFSPILKKGKLKVKRNS